MQNTAMFLPLPFRRGEGRGEGSRGAMSKFGLEFGNRG